MLHRFSTIPTVPLSKEFLSFLGSPILRVLLGMILENVSCITVAFNGDQVAVCHHNIPAPSTVFNLFYFKKKNNTVNLMVSIVPRISSFYSHFANLFRTAPSTPVMKGMTVTLIFYVFFFFYFSERYRYLLRFTQTVSI